MRVKESKGESTIRCVTNFNVQGRPRPEIKYRALGEDVLDTDVQSITEAARHNNILCTA